MINVGDKIKNHLIFRIKITFKLTLTIRTGNITSHIKSFT